MEDWNEELRQRIDGLLCNRKLSRNKLSQGSGLSQTAINNQLSEKVKPNTKAKISLELVKAVLDKFPDVTADWLLRGQEPSSTAEALLQNTSAEKIIANNHNTTVNDSEAVRCVVRQLEEKDRQIEEKDKQISRLMQMLERQQLG